MYIEGKRKLFEKVLLLALAINRIERQVIKMLDEKEKNPLDEAAEEWEKLEQGLADVVDELLKHSIWV